MNLQKIIESMQANKNFSIEDIMLTLKTIPQEQHEEFFNLINRTYGKEFMKKLKEGEN